MIRWSDLDPLVVHVDRDLLELVSRFLERRHEDLARLETALAQDDFASLAAISHDLKGVGDSFGIGFITDYGVAIERAVSRGDREAARSHVSHLKADLARAEIVPA